MKIIQETESQSTIGQIVADNFRTADVFKKYNIDFCCKGNRLLSDVCKEKNLNIETIKRELQDKAAKSNSRPNIDFRQMPLDELAEYIVQVHHSFIKENIPMLMVYLNKVNKVHGARHPELNEILVQFINCSGELTQHMAKEEAVLFPAIMKIAEADRANEIINKSFSFGTLLIPITAMQSEHITEGDRAAKIAKLTNNFTPPEDACTTYRVAFQKLEEFINDLYVHIHLENNILFPRAVELEGHVVQIGCLLQ